ncbi:hypothetical protein Val02_75160 [Virgisporangium aliadipatigenens]|uniref:Uncharacterized protein n=1 Tax=Virgisporangium aliadipatigenens TaxID=741659 RepID=A0A8J3YVM1_9ACTN|nr:hypothetical protein [Virgisporangium aliadipatigenens]GIJ50630.1 hypothetical protein Val02_75160 [Virgisporangium aliadipatigenens]
MTDHGEQLREAFETHETLAPDPAAVYARVLELSRIYKRRRRGAQVAGGAVLSAGLIAGAVQLPSVLGGHPRGIGINAGAPGSPIPSVAPSFTQADLDRYWAAYFAAGYGYDDAVQLAALWHTGQNIGQVKAEAGRRLLAGETLPIPPHPNPSDPTTSEPAVPADAAALAAFFGAGYVWDDAVQLAALWNLPSPSEAKVVAGKKLEAGEKLPIEPKPENVAAQKESTAVAKFFSAGYTYEDAVELAALWNLPDPYEAKVAGGQKLLAGETLPIKP